jgi:hypothetical protein
MAQYRVTVEVPNLPIWGVQAFFDLLHRSLGKPDIEGNGVTATLVVGYSLTASQYEVMRDLEDRLWQPLEVTVKRVTVRE